MKIFTKQIDHLDCESRAMIQAFYSRSTMSIEDRVKTIGDNEDQIKKSLKQVYINYGHESVAEMTGGPVVFFEGVSMLAAKAIQNHPLYIGQESSTRYIDFSKQEFIAPNNNEFYQRWSEIFRNLYVDLLPKVIEDIENKYPYELNKTDKYTKSHYDKTVKARAFDILRGLLPAGFATNVALSSNARVVRQILKSLAQNPLEEIRKIGLETNKQLCESYPSLFKPNEFDNEKPVTVYGGDFSSAKEVFDEFPPVVGTDVSDLDGLDCADYENSLILDLIDIKCFLSLDFASFRDMLRHRRCKILMPTLAAVEFEKYYIDNLPESDKVNVQSILSKFCYELAELQDSEENKQYIVPMGFKVPVMCKMSLNQAAYFCSLRSGKTVHQTLRVLAQQVAKEVYKIYKLKLPRVDFDEDNFTLKRGTQDIIDKNES